MQENYQLKKIFQIPAVKDRGQRPNKLIDPVQQETINEMYNLIESLKIYNLEISEQLL